MAEDPVVQQGETAPFDDGWEVPLTDGHAVVGATSEIPAVEQPLPPYLHPDDPDDDWSKGPARKGLRLGVPTAALLVLLLIGGGFWGGALSEKHHNPSSSSSNALSALANRFASAARSGAGGRTGAGGFGGFGGAAPAATGIVTAVKGSTLYVTDTNGNLVKVTVGSSATITRTASSSLAGLQAGDTVVVTGSKASNGTVTATGIRASASGVTTTPGGGGFGGGGAGSGG